jgi:homoserine dehydrogenase
VERLSLSQPAHADRTDLDRPPVKIALLGCGTVGSGVAQLLLQHSNAVASRGGHAFVLAGIAVRSAEKARSPAFPRSLFTTDATALVDDPTIGMIVECIGGLTAAGELVERALRRGKFVVTANKDLLATKGPALRSLAAAHGVTIAYEAAVGGAIPIVRTLMGSLAGESILEVGGVLNGTTNFVLDAMSRGAAYDDALARAHRGGYAEADSSSDTSGRDAAHKLAILSQLAFRRSVTIRDIPRRGIEGIVREDVSLGRDLGYSLKLIAVARDCEATVTPAFVPREHPFAQPSGVHNCIRIIGRSAGTLTFAGAGAGREPTASAVIADIIAAVGAMRNRRFASEDEPMRTCDLLRPPLMRTLIRISGDTQRVCAALRETGIEAATVDGTSALLTQPVHDAAHVGEILRARNVPAASVFPVWEDLALDQFPAEASLGGGVLQPAL